ncbi:MAG: hypothetical protein JSS35_20395 [Proteobacteria bacterium]|nr:hypothetical protein [Pseudomonadota bacterium]
MRPTTRTIRRLSLGLGLGLTAFAALILAAICLPQPLFAHHLRRGQVDLWSDRPIPPQARAVLDEAQRRIARSPLWSAEQRFRIFICNDNWRLALYSLRFSGRMAGATDTLFTGNVYMRESDLAANRLIPASPGADLADRPLAYYLAHEMTHTLEMRAFGRAPGRRYPHWLVEGYADYVGKAGAFDYAANLAALRVGDPAMDWERSGLYRVYHLYAAHYLDRLGLGVRQLFAAPPSEARARSETLADRI